MENKLSNQNQTIFEEIKRNEYKNEYWTARDLSKVLEYSEYRHFKPIIDKAKESCTNSIIRFKAISRISPIWCQIEFDDRILF